MKQKSQPRFLVDCCNFTPDSEDEVPEHGLVTELPVALRDGRGGEVAEQGELVVVKVPEELRCDGQTPEGTKIRHTKWKKINQMGSQHEEIPEVAAPSLFCCCNRSDG